MSSSANPNLKKDEQAFELYPGYGSVISKLDSDTIREIELSAFKAGVDYAREEYSELKKDECIKILTDLLPEHLTVKGFHGDSHQVACFLVEKLLAARL